jgi:hypothetical protein
MICDRWSFDDTACSSGSSRAPRLVSARDAYAGKRTSHACAPTVARRKTVESAKNARADAAALPSSSALSTTTVPSADGEGNAPRTEPYADRADRDADGGLAGHERLHRGGPEQRGLRGDRRLQEAAGGGLQCGGSEHSGREYPRREREVRGEIEREDEDRKDDEVQTSAEDVRGLTMVLAERNSSAKHDEPVWRLLLPAQGRQSWPQ